MRVKLELPLIKRQIADDIAQKDIARWWGVDPSTIDDFLTRNGIKYNSFRKSSRREIRESILTEINKIIETTSHVFPVEVAEYWQKRFESAELHESCRDPVTAIKRIYLGLLHGQSYLHLAKAVKIPRHTLLHYYNELRSQVAKRRTEISKLVCDQLTSYLSEEDQVAFQLVCVQGLTHKEAGRLLSTANTNVTYRLMKIAKEFPILREIVITRSDQEGRLERKMQSVEARQANADLAVKDCAKSNLREYSKIVRYKALHSGADATHKLRQMVKDLPRLHSIFKQTKLPRAIQSIAVKIIINNFEWINSSFDQLKDAAIEIYSKIPAELSASNKSEIFKSFFSTKYLSFEDKKAVVDFSRIQLKLDRYIKIIKIVVEEARITEPESPRLLATLTKLMLRRKKDYPSTESIKEELAQYISKYKTTLASLKECGFSDAFARYLASLSFFKAKPMNKVRELIVSKFDKINDEELLGSEMLDLDRSRSAEPLLALRDPSQIQQAFELIMSKLNTNSEQLLGFFSYEIYHALTHLNFHRLGLNPRAVLASYPRLLESISFENRRTLKWLSISAPILHAAWAVPTNCPLDEDRQYIYLQLRDGYKDFTLKNSNLACSTLSPSIQSNLKRIAMVMNERELMDRSILRSLYLAVSAEEQKKLTPQQRHSNYPVYSSSLEWIIERFPEVTMTTAKTFSRLAALCEMNPASLQTIQRLTAQYDHCLKLCIEKVPHYSKAAKTIALHTVLKARKDQDLKALLFQYLRQYLEIVRQYGHLPFICGTIAISSFDHKNPKLAAIKSAEKIRRQVKLFRLDKVNEYTERAGHELIHDTAPEPNRVVERDEDLANLNQAVSNLAPADREIVEEFLSGESADLSDPAIKRVIGQLRKQLTF